ncbi:MAG: hypothetical protein EP350_06515 [Alphaproteobacteria bacterium]|nr:MAG: hypothetical protein EP350_06515 [Alphaproteobacteria bacterium]
MIRTAIPIAVSLLCSTAALAQDDEPRPSQMNAAQIARELGVSDDDRRPEEQLRVKLLGSDLVIGGEVEVGVKYKSNYALGTEAGDTDTSLNPEGKLELIWELGSDLVAFAKGKVVGEVDDFQRGVDDSDVGVELGEAWLLKTRIGGTPFALQVGRQQLQDRREWWWDEDLDMVRLHYFGDRVTAFAGIGRELGNYSTLGGRDPEDRGIVRKLGSVKWDWAERQQIQLFALDQSDRSSEYVPGAIVEPDLLDKSELDATWLGLRVRGRVKAKFPGKIYYWGDIARVRGHEIAYQTVELTSGTEQIVGAPRQRVSGWAYDIGASFELPVPAEPYLTVSHARGSGGDTPFRQTELHGNNGKFRGNSRFRYYGEVLRPDLSNLKVLTAALGVEPVEDGWLEAVWHRYHQVTALPEISGSRLDIEPDGISPRLGQEVNLIASFRPTSGWDFELTGGVFEAGPAFGTLDGERAWLAELKIAKNF